jgi:hypothetical protein
LDHFISVGIFFISLVMKAIRWAAAILGLQRRHR